MKAQTLMNRAPVDWEKTVDRVTPKDRDTLRRELEGIAKRAAMLAGYLDERGGNGDGDQGHRAAMKTANSHGKQVWMKVFGYNGYHEFTV